MGELIRFRMPRGNVAPIDVHGSTAATLRAIAASVERVNAPIAELIRSVNLVAKAGLPPHVERALRLGAELAPKF